MVDWSEIKVLKYVLLKRPLFQWATFTTLLLNVYILMREFIVMVSVRTRAKGKIKIKWRCTIHLFITITCGEFIRYLLWFITIPRIGLYITGNIGTHSSVGSTRTVRQVIKNQIKYGFDRFASLFELTQMR